jgi:predicted aconitase
VFLSKREDRILRGEEGEAKRLALKMLVSIGEAYGAKRMIRIRSAQISGVSYKTIGEPGLEFLQDFSSGGAVATVRAMLNPAGMDLEKWRELGVPEEFARKQLKIMEFFHKMKVQPTCSCIPYFAGGPALKGEHVAWAESSAVVFANSILGAYTNREGGPTALASAILGLTPLYGMHLKEQRKPTHLVRLKCRLKNELDFSLLGYWIGRSLGSCLPRIDGLQGIRSFEKLKAMSASLAASGAISMFSLEKAGRKKHEETVDIGEEELLEIRDNLSSARQFKHVCLGCPHLNLQELKLIARLVAGRETNMKLWCFTSRHLRDIAERHGYVGAIERAGGKVICDTCMVVSPIEEMGVDGIVTNSCKAAHYLRSLNRMESHLASLEECVRYALA